MDAVEKASSGHPGAPMGLADIAEVLWRDILRFNPKNPDWWNRDRFVLSNGHASMLLYAVLHLTGYKVSIDDIRAFRQLHSKTAGHPEHGECPGVETTTGPLGQGLANAVGMALAERQLGKEFNREGFNLVDHHTWVCVGDGCLMEGVSHEVASLAGTLGLGKLIAIYDDNGVSIDGETKGWFTEDVGGRFRAYDWHVVDDVDGHGPKAFLNAAQSAIRETSKPTLICCRTTIGYGSPNKGGKAVAHGAPLGGDEVWNVREQLNWPHEAFHIPASLKNEWDATARGASLEEEWNSLFREYQVRFPDLGAEFERRMRGEISQESKDALLALARTAQSKRETIETRKASGACLDAIGPLLPELLGGSADLTGSNNTQWNGAGWMDEGGRYLNYGVREFGMTAIANGLALHGGIIPYTGTFLVFMEYARNAVRLASLMGIRNILVYTHDSVGLGEDGPTHQPIEQLTNLRTTPNMSVWRPCDMVETAFAWKAALERENGPTAIILTRQKTQPQARDETKFDEIDRGGYVLRKESGKLDVVIVATGSEVEVAVAAAEKLADEDVNARIVSMPCVDRFLEQESSYQESVLPPNTAPRLAVEAAHPDYWRRFVGLEGDVVGINRFGVSAPGAEALDHLGINAEAVVDAVHQLLS